jgi:hypothetical protein
MGSVRKAQVEYLLEVPSLPDDGSWVADLRLVVPIEKSHLMGKEPIDGFPDEDGRRLIGERIAMMHTRPAFDKAFIEIVTGPLLAKLAVLAKKEPALFTRVCGGVYALAVRSDRLASMSLESLELYLLCHENLTEESTKF